MKPMKLFSVICCILLFSNCGSIKLMPVSLNQNSSLTGYQYVYITPTASVTSNTGSVYNGVGSMTSKNANPSAIIAGYMFKKGFSQLPTINPELASQTLIVNYGESNRTAIWWGLLGYKIEITLQFLSAETNEVVCTATAEGFGETEADDIRQAINRALNEIFAVK